VKITIRNFRNKVLWAIAALALSVGGYQSVIAQPGQSPNFGWLRGAAIGSAPAWVCQGLDTNVSCDIRTQGTGTLLLNGAAIPGVSGGAGVFTTVTASGLITQNGGEVTLFPGIGVGVTASLKASPIRVFSNITTAPTTGTVIETLYTYVLPANGLATDGQALSIEIWASTAANGNNKTLTAVFGATTIGTSTAAGFNNETQSMRCQVYRTGAATQKARCNFESFVSGTLSAARNTVMFSTAPAETLSGPVTILVRGTTPTAAGDLVAQAATVDWYPQGQ
jgi:hypothetical protein